MKEDRRLNVEIEVVKLDIRRVHTIACVQVYNIELISYTVHYKQ